MPGLTPRHNGRSKTERNFPLILRVAATQASSLLTMQSAPTPIGELRSWGLPKQILAIRLEFVSSAQQLVQKVFDLACSR